MPAAFPVPVLLAVVPSGPVLMLWIALGAMVVAFLVAWYVAGLDPRTTAGPETTDPPPEVSAAGMRYLALREFDHTCLAAGILELRRHGHIEIGEDDAIRFRRNDAGPLHEPERELLDALREDPGQLTNAEARYAAALTRALVPRYLSRNSLFGLPIRILAIAAMLWLIVATPVGSTGGLLAHLVAVSAGAFGLVYLVWMAQSRMRGGRFFRRWDVPLAALAVHALATWLWASRYVSWQVAPLAALVVGFSVVAADMLHAPTREGRALLARILGFRQGLGLLGDDERVGSYLPYSVALGFEDAWNDRFRAG